MISSFIDTKEIADLPLLVCYEAKSLKNKHDRLMELLNKRGYIFLNGADGVAMLLPDRALPPQRKAGRRKKRKGRHSKE